MCLIMTEEGWRNLSDGLVCSNHNRLEGVFNPPTVEEAQAETGFRISQYIRDVKAHIDGDLPKEQIFRSFAAPIHGAFGERL